MKGVEIWIHIDCAINSAMGICSEKLDIDTCSDAMNRIPEPIR